MKKWMTIALAALLCLTVLFLALWIDAKNSHEDLEYMCRASAAQCVTALQELESGSDDSYIKAAAEFRSFMNAYGWLTEGEGKSENYNICGRVYGCLVYDQSQSAAAAQELLRAMKLLAEDPYNENAFLNLLNFVNAIEHVGE